MIKEYTTYYSFKKPTVNGSNGIWGLELNQDLTDIDTELYNRYTELYNRNFENYIINPCFLINQYYGTATQTLSDGRIFADMWTYHTTGISATGVILYNREADYLRQTGYNNKTAYGGKFAVQTAATNITPTITYYIENMVEGINYQSLHEYDYATISFYVKCTKTGTYCVALQNQDKTRSYIFEYSIASTDWEKKELTYKPDKDSAYWTEYEENSITTCGHLRIIFPLAAGFIYQGTDETWLIGNYIGTSNQANLLETTTNIIRFTQLKLEPGNIATDFELRPIQSELSLCERYFEKSYNLDVPVGTNTAAGAFYVRPKWGLSGAPLSNGLGFSEYIKFRVKKSFTPSVTLYGGVVTDFSTSLQVKMTLTCINQNSFSFMYQFTTTNQVTSTAYYFGTWWADSQLT